MKQKDYQFKGFKFLRKASRFFAGLGLCLVVLSILPLPKEKAVAATVYNNGDITFTTELLVDGKADNLIRILKSGGKAVNLTVSLTVQARQNPSAITLGGSAPDKIATGNTIAGDVAIFGMGQVLINSDQSNCTKEKLYDIPLFGTAKQYLRCSLNKPGYDGVMADKTTAKSIAVGQKQNYTFSIDNSVLSALKAGPNTTSSSTPFFQVAPWVQLNFLTALSEQNWTITDAGKQIYVQYFDNQADLQKAIDNNIRPSDAQNYGANSNSASMGDSGSAILGFINQLINVLVGLIQQFVYYVFYLFIAPIIQAMLSIRTYTDTFAAVIYPGWEIVRNLCNILFIVALIAIGLGTLFRLESYQYKHLLVDLIIAAFLVNFSLVIAQVVLGVADTIQAQFLPNNVEVIRALARDLMAGWKNINFSNISQSGFFANTVAPLFELGLTLGSFVVFSAIAVFLFVRIIMLWVLLMLSPMAYAMRVLPQTKSYAGKWWGEFLKYAFFTPIMAFFLNMAAVINNTYNKTPVFQQILDHPELVGDSSIAQFVFKVGSNFIILVFLMVAIKVAEQAGVYGADAVSKAAQGGMFAPFKAAAGGGKLAAFGVKSARDFALEKYFEKTGRDLRPSKWIEGWKHSRHENQQKREALGQAKALGKGSPFGNPTSFFQRYWNIGTPKRLWKGGDKEGRKLIKKAEGIKADYLKKKDELKAEMDKKGAGDKVKIEALEKELEHLMEEYRHVYHEGHHLLAPVDYHTQKEFRSNVDQEKGKIHTKNWHELWDLFAAARHEKEAIRAIAILKKVTETYNENEFINKAQYIENMKAKDSAEWADIQAQAKKDGKSEKEIEEMGEKILHKKGEFFTYSAEGAENFRNQILEKELGLGREVSMQVMSDVSDTAEEKNHRVIMRMYGSRDGKLYFKTKAEREPEVRAENNKMNAEAMINFCNRLGGFEEHPDADYDLTESRSAVLTAPILAYYMEHYSDIEPLVRRGRINTSQAKAVFENVETIRKAAIKFDDDLDKDGNLKLYEDLNITFRQPTFKGTETKEEQEQMIYKAKVEQGIFKTKKQMFIEAIDKISEKGQALATKDSGENTISQAMEYVSNLPESKPKLS